MSKETFYYNLGKEKYQHNKSLDLDYSDNYYIQQLFDKNPEIPQEYIDSFRKGWEDTCEECKYNITYENNIQKDNKG